MNDFLQNLRNIQPEEQKSQPKVRKSFDNSYHHNTNSRFHSHGAFTRSTQHLKRAPANAVHPAAPAQKTVAPAGQAGVVESSLLADAIENLSSHVETLVKTQEYTAAIQERISTAFERQTQVFEEMVSLFQTFLGTHGGQSAVSNPVPRENTFREKKVIRTESPTLSGAKEEPFSPAHGDGSLFGRKIRPVVRKRMRTETVSRQESPKGLSGDADRMELMGRKEIMDIIYSMRDQGATFEQVAKYLTDLGQPTFSGRGEWHAQTVHRLCNK